MFYEIETLPDTKLDWWYFTGNITNVNDIENLLRMYKHFNLPTINLN